MRVRQRVWELTSSGRAWSICGGGMGNGSARLIRFRLSSPRIECPDVPTVTNGIAPK